MFIGNLFQQVQGFYAKKKSKKPKVDNKGNANPNTPNTEEIKKIQRELKLKDRFFQSLIDSKKHVGYNNNTKKAINELANLYKKNKKNLNKLNKKISQVLNSIENFVKNECFPRGLMKFNGKTGQEYEIGNKNPTIFYYALTYEGMNIPALHFTFAHEKKIFSFQQTIITSTNVNQKNIIINFANFMNISIEHEKKITDGTSGKKPFAYLNGIKCEIIEKQVAPSQLSLSYKISADNKDIPKKYHGQILERKIYNTNGQLVE